MRGHSLGTNHKQGLDRKLQSQDWNGIRKAAVAPPHAIAELRDVQKQHAKHLANTCIDITTCDLSPASNRCRHMVDLLRDQLRTCLFNFLCVFACVRVRKTTPRMRHRYSLLYISMVCARIKYTPRNRNECNQLTQGVPINEHLIVQRDIIKGKKTLHFIRLSKCQLHQ
jgi:hypothetical protein